MSATSIAFEPAAQAFWVGTADGVAFRLDGSTRRTVRMFESSAASSLVLSADAAAILATDAAGAVVVRRTDDGQPVDAFHCGKRVARARILGPRTYATVDAFRAGFVWSIDDAGNLAATPIRDDGLNPAAFDDFGAAPGGDRCTLLDSLHWMTWERATNSVTAVHRPVRGSMLAYLDGLVGLSASGGHYFIHWDECMVFDTATGKIVWEADLARGADCGALSGDGMRLAIGTRNGAVSVLSGNGAVSAQPTEHAVTSVTIEGNAIGWIDRSGGFGVIDATSGAEIVTRAQGLEWLR